MPDFTIRDVFPGEHGEVWAAGFYTPTDVVSFFLFPYRQLV